MKDDSVYVALYVIITFVGLIAYGWSKLRKNNIFMKNPSTRPEDMVSIGPLRYADGRVSGSGWPFYYIYCLGVAVLLAQITVYELLDPPPNLLTNNATNSAPNYIWFCLSLFLVLAGLLNSYLLDKDTSFEDHPYLRYIIKVWLSTIFISPVIILAIFILKGAFPGVDTLSNVFLFLVIGGNGCGMLSFMLFGFAVHYVSMLHWEERKKRIVILAAAELLTFITAAVFASKLISQLNWLVIAFPYAVVMGVSIMLCKLEKPAPVVADVDDTTPEE